MSSGPRADRRQCARRRTLQTSADYGPQLEAGADGVGDERLAEPGADGVLGSPSGAVGGDDDAGHQRAKVVQDPGDERLEDRSAEVEPAHHRVERAFLGQAPGVAADADDSGVAAAGDHQEPLVLDVDDQGLLIEDQRVRLPAAAEPCLLRRQTWLVAGGAGHPRRSPGRTGRTRSWAAAPQSPRSRRRPAPGGL